MAQIKWSRICRYCKHENHAALVFCEKCGRRIRGIITPLSCKRMKPKALLCEERMATVCN